MQWWSNYCYYSVGVVINLDKLSLEKKMPAIRFHQIILFFVFLMVYFYSFFSKVLGVSLSTTRKALLCMFFRYVMFLKMMIKVEVFYPSQKCK